MKTLRILTTACFAAVVLTVAARAADLTGDWTWTSQSPTGPVKMSAKLVQKKDALSGTVTGRQGPAEIKDASIKDGVVTFTVVRGNPLSNKTTFTYSGVIAGDTITGTILRNIPGNPPFQIEWKASRVK
jgi:hypothetical protein